MDLRQLEYLVGVVDHGGFTKAAAALHVAQPSLSQAVRRLESELGVALFVRLGRGVRPTDAGDAFVARARLLLRDARTAQATAQAYAELHQGHLDLVALPTLVADPLAALIGAFRRTHPHITFRVAEPTSAYGLRAMVRDGRSEIGLTESVPGEDDLHEVPLGAQELMAILPPDPTASTVRTDRHDRVALGDLVRFPFVAGPVGTSARDLVEETCRRIGASVEVAVETGQREAMVALVLAGVGVTVLPTTLADDARRRGAIVRPVDPPLVRAIALVHRVDALSPAGEAFVRQAITPPGCARPVQT